MEKASASPAQSGTSTAPKPLRLWPGVVIVALQWFTRFVLPIFVPEAMIVAVMAGLAGGVAVLIWWAFFSRAAISERLGAIGLMIVAIGVTPAILHVSIATGNMGLMFPIYAIPVLSLAFVAWAVATRDLPTGTRRWTMVATILLACAVWALFQTGGNTTSLDHDFAWRWAQTPEERLLAQAEDELTPLPAVAATAANPAPANPGQQPTEPESSAADSADEASPSTFDEDATAIETASVDANPIAAEPRVDPPASDSAPAEWPGFRGADRDSIIADERIATDWAASPPTEIWRRPIGPGWSSFAVQGDLLYTQEQRGDDEIVACYRTDTGEPVWRHRDTARFWESVGGAGPRGTPTLHEGRVYTLGGTGILNALDARTGARVWSRNAASDTGAELPGWGFSGSPLVYRDLIIVTTSGALSAYDLATGEPRWTGPSGSEGYSSPHLVTLDGVEQILHLSGDGLVGVAPADGKELWEHDWSGYPIVQPAQTADGDVLISTNSDSGIRRLAIRQGPDGWQAEERWTSIRLKPYFNDFVVHEGHAYGFDGSILASIDVETGERDWKGGRYGGGQLVLLAEQDLLLVLSEDGELALVNATPDKFTERAKMPAIEGKTWNHPVLVDGLLLVRNAEEMAAFRLSPAEGGGAATGSATSP